jgi:hypothetical protein
MHMQLWNTALLIADVVKVFNPQSPQGARHFGSGDHRHCRDGGHLFAVVVGIAREAAGLLDSFLLATPAPQFLGISFLTAAHQKNSNETAIKGELNEMKSRIGTRDDSVAAACDQYAAGHREGKAKM